MSKTLTAIQIGVLTLLSPISFAYSPFVVKDIRVEGIQRTEAGTVFNYLPIHIGDTVNEGQVSSAIKALYATGFYRDVKIDVDNGVLVVSVEERPAISSISFAGNKEFDSKDLLKGLKDVGIAESRTFDRSQLEKAEQEIKRLYLTKSYYGVSVRTTVSPLERNRVAINFEVTEGVVAKIKNIRILGAHAFKESRLVNRMALEEAGGMFAWFRHDKYSKQELQADIEDLRSWYMDHGYINFSVDSTQVSITPDKKDVYISISITEGEKYKISSVKLAGELLVPEPELRKLVTLKSGEIYSRAKVNGVTRAISDRLGNDGYAFANVNAVPEINEKTREVALTLYVDPGRRAYVHRINVIGNSKTRDEVVRREMLQMESAWFDREKVDQSKTHIKRTGYFEDVTIDTVPVSGASDQVDLNVNLKERATGALSVGVGYSASDHLALMGSISQSNLFGTGNSLSLSANTGSTNRAVSLNYSNPYWTEDGVSRTWTLYDRKVDTTSYDDVAQYKTGSIGGGVKFGIPISLDDKIYFGGNIDNTRITLTDTSPVLYQDFVEKFGSHNNTISATVGWSRDQRDSAMYPTTGTYQQFNTEIATPLGDLTFLRSNYKWQRFFSLSPTYTLMLNSDFGYAVGYGGQPVPFYKNFYAGGIGSVRGFKDNTIGPKVTSNEGTDYEETDAIGGTRRILGSAEVFFPFPGMKEKDRSLRLSVFLDSGTVWGVSNGFAVSDFRASTGLGMSWISPIGPLKFSFAIPIKKKSGDETQNFQFLMGTTM